ncbi:uncharacterized protein K452DRAFT_302232 [Aplosporella prunicola CBS 121167]|uniref:Uncharacterized protein n=1 Tax=Aplosporella prunicola CBS 121167 TaxID=1176127 RepID=A0A6A6B0I7_9PEZI|nr:uncharacterized protein K452DRAFT_302232 [Aplosporella prunicola CBS 121167]KAF2137068.1 hypothetical protein K452DRAFT_302232 [Aplosporella prunicola CBS 121167]
MPRDRQPLFLALALANVSAERFGSAPFTWETVSGRSDPYWGGNMSDDEDEGDKGGDKGGDDKAGDDKGSDDRVGDDDQKPDAEPSSKDKRPASKGKQPA